MKSKELFEAELNMTSLVNYFSERILDNLIGHYYDTQETGDPYSEQEMTRMLSDEKLFDDLFDDALERVHGYTKQKVLDELPQRLKQARRELIAQKRQRRD